MNGEWLKLFIQQSFAVVRFDSSLLYDDAKIRNTIFKKMRPQFPHFEMIDNTKAMLFVNPVKKIKLTIKNDQIIVDITDPPNMNILKSHINEIVPFVLREFDADKTNFIGVRVHVIPERMHHSVKTNNSIFNNFFSPKLISHYGLENNEMVSNPQIGFSLELDAGLKMNVNVGTNQKVNGVLKNGSFEVSEVLETNPLIDLDVYTQVLKEPDQINGVVRASIQKIEKYYSEIENMIVGSYVK